MRVSRFLEIRKIISTEAKERKYPRTRQYELHDKCHLSAPDSSQSTIEIRASFKLLAR